MKNRFLKYTEFGSKVSEDLDDEFHDEDEDRQFPDEESYDLEDEDQYQNDMEYLCHTIRSLFKTSDMEVDVDYNGYDISIYSFPEKREKISSILKIFDIVYKLKKDILPQYESEFELYESKKGDPVFSFQFSYDSDGVSSGEDLDDGPFK